MSEKTEQPTPKKIRDARKEGQVSHSKDVTQTALIVALFGYTLANSDAIVRTIGEMMLLPASLMTMDFEAAVNVLATQLLREAAILLAPYLAIVIGLGLFVELAQTGMNVSAKAATPSGKKLDVVQNAKNLFSARSLVEFVKSVVKIALLSIIVWMLLRSQLPALITLPGGGLTAVGVATGVLLKALIVSVSVGYIVISIADYFWQRHKYLEELKMTKEEVLKEYKEAEGDPHIKHKRKELHRELMENNEGEAAKRASVVVTNPTHLAVAIRYDKELAPLPVVLAKAEGARAFRIAQIAREHGVPVLQNIPLARALMADAQINEYIPSELIEPVAEVLRLVREMQDEEPH